MGSVNYSVAYSDALGERYLLKSKIRDLLLDKSKLEFDGNRAVIVNTPDPFEIRQYTRSGLHRYGDPETATDTAQRFELKYDWAYTGTFDAGDKSDSGAYKKACATRVGFQHDAAVNPSIDRMALYEIAHHAGTIEGCSASAFTKNTIYGLISSAQTVVFNETASDDDLTLVIGGTKYDLLRNCPEFDPSEKLSTYAKEKGFVGTVCNCRVQKVPDNYMPKNVFFMIVKKDAAFAQMKYESVKVHDDPPGISGTLVEGRFYCGAAVRGEKAGGIYVLADSSYVSEAPALSKSGNAVSCSAAGSGNQILYTVDGSDPRYSITARVYSSAVTCASGDTFKAVIVPIIPVNQKPKQIFESNLKFASPVAEITV